MESSERSHLATYPTSVKGVLLLDGRVLLVKNSRDEWELPGGRIDEGEEHSQTLSREFAEELSINIALSALIDSYLFEVIPGRHVLSSHTVAGLRVSFDQALATNTTNTVFGQWTACQS